MRCIAGGDLMCMSAQQQRGYALEAWRLLDHNSDIIPDAVRAARVVCVPGGQKKELRKVLHVQAAIKFETGVFKVVNRFCINKVFFLLLRMTRRLYNTKPGCCSAFAMYAYAFRQDGKY